MNGILVVIQKNGTYSCILSNSKGDLKYDIPLEDIGLLRLSRHEKCFTSSLCEIYKLHTGQEYFQLKEMLEKYDVSGVNV